MYWLPKLAKNKLRDARNKRALTQLGWRYFVVWECNLKRPQQIQKRLEAFLDA